ncbi:hypothetical protein GCM10022254_60510 [Actinomadura meridiana]|uniref:Uncharacterized protein n=1 Tax=Actinomadura meridiana TaxID=559626 RepID=A0ABP8CIB1_9ACTN
MAALELVYAEYESGEPPFVWFDEERRPAEPKRQAIHMIGLLRRKGKHRRGRQGLSIRHNNDLLIQTTVGLSHDDGGPQGVVVIIRRVGGGAGWTAAMTERIAKLLRDGQITVHHDEFRSVLEWGARSRSERILSKLWAWARAAN